MSPGRISMSVAERIEQAENRALSALLAVRTMHRRLAFHERARDGSDPDVYCGCCSEAVAYALLLGKSA